MAANELLNILYKSVYVILYLEHSPVAAGVPKLKPVVVVAAVGLPKFNVVFKAGADVFVFKATVCANNDGAV